MISPDFQNFNSPSSLYEKLRSEHLLINHEQSILSNLNSEIDAIFSELSKRIWICRHEQDLLSQLINSDVTVCPENCYQLLNNLNCTKFVEAHKILGHHAAEIVHVFKMLCMAPKSVASFLNAAEKVNSLYPIFELCISVFNILYGSCLFSEDEKNLLELLDHLIVIQLVQNPDPRRVLRKCNSTFSRMYKLFSEALPLTKVFLTAALHEPIMFLLCQDELFFDIDPAKSRIRIPKVERDRLFGPDESSKSYQEKFAQHRKILVDKLVAIMEKFISSIINAIPMFPKSIIWLVQQMHTALIIQKLISKREATLICTDLIFTYFICSAVINPEPLGIISDTPISYIARFNLMQIGQLLQTLAILPYEKQQIPAYFNEILTRLNPDSMSTVMNLILGSSAESASIETIFSTQVSDSEGNEVFKRRNFVGTLQEINVLQSFLKSSAIDEINDTVLRNNLKNTMKKLPEKLSEITTTKFTIDAPSPTIGKTLDSTQTISSSMRLRSFADRVQTVASRSHQRLMQTSSVSNLRNFHQRHLSNSASANMLNSENTPLHNADDVNNGEENESAFDPQVVLMFTIADNTESFGLESEEAIMNTSDNMQNTLSPIFGEERSYFDLDNLIKCRAFLDTKRKLRLVLSYTSSLPNITIKLSTNPKNGNDDQQKNDDENDHSNSMKMDEMKTYDLHQILQIHLAESINSRDPKRTALIRECQRCLSDFDNRGIALLLNTMKQEQRNRMAYILYLQNSRLTCLQLKNFLNKIKQRVQREMALTSECIVEIVVRFSLQKKDQFMRQFVHKFQSLRVQDEKIDLVDTHLRNLCEQLVVEPMWHFASLENIEYARKCLERTLMAHIYTFALFPNGDADYYRDEVFHKSIQQLSSQITVDHIELAIPKGLHAECPWPSAQAELAIINAYKSPRDKMACIIRCCEQIENLIVFSPGRQTASADDILPILVFVIIKANPPAIFSNLQFIDGFYGAKRMQGAEAYWWTQFNSAIEFLKTLLNKLCN